jgi:hypothetical protein
VGSCGDGGARGDGGAPVDSVDQRESLEHQGHRLEVRRCLNGRIALGSTLTRGGGNGGSGTDTITKKGSPMIGADRRRSG